MVEFNNLFRLCRMVTFGVASFFALIVIILGGLITNFSDTYLGGFFSFAALGIATGLLTLLTLPTMIALSMMRKGAMTSMVVVEIVWTWFLWIMWLSVGGSSASIYFIGNCGRYTGLGSVVEAACNESSALTAFGFLAWIVLIAYNFTLIFLTFRQHLRGHTTVWTKDVTETDFTAIGGNNTQVVYDPKVSPTMGTEYPPAHMGIPANVAPQQTANSYTQQTASPYPQPQGPGSFTHPTTSPYPQV